MRTIALFNHHPECSNQCCSGIINALQSKYTFKLFSEQDIKDGFLSGVDIIAFPGGIGDSNSYYNFFRRKQANIIANFVENGGYYLGICMGAYWAAHYYFDILDSVEAVQHIKRKDSSTKRPYKTTVPVTWKGVKNNMFFYDGCSLLGDETKFKTIARYENGDPMAIIQNRVGVIGCHPESENSWYNEPYLKDRWHEGKHHNLLLDFVDELVEM
jgi:glutamine amidotransferase-like uncharacterized protein